MVWKAGLTCRVTCQPSLERPQDSRHRTLVPTAQSLALCTCQQGLLPGFPCSFGSASEFSSSQQSRQARLVKPAGEEHPLAIPAWDFYVRNRTQFWASLSTVPLPQPCGVPGSPASLEEDGLEGLSGPGPQAISGASSSISGVLPSGQWVKTTEQARHAPWPIWTMNFSSRPVRRRLPSCPEVTCCYIP